MWVPSALLELFSIGKETVTTLREELATIRSERDILKQQLTVAQIQSDWLRMKVNQLELERTALLEKAYAIKLPAPEIVRTPVLGEASRVGDFSYDDMGDSLAKKLGLPTYDN